MATRWSSAPDGVRAVPDGPSRAASIAGALLTLVGTTLALLIIGALLLPGLGGSEDPGVAAGASPSAPAAVATSSLASPLPVASAAAIASTAPDPTIAPIPTEAPATTPRATLTPAPTTEPLQVALRTAAPVTQAGRELGRVTVQAIRQVKRPDTLADDERLMVAVVRLDAADARLPYDELHFRLEDENGERYEPVAEAAPKPLGSGAVPPSAQRSGQVAFAVPADRRVVSVVLTDGAGDDLVVFSRPLPAT